MSGNTLAIGMSSVVTLIFSIPCLIFISKKNSNKKKINRGLYLIFVILYSTLFIFWILFFQGLFKDTIKQNEQNTTKKVNIYLAKETYFDDHIPYILNHGVYEKLISNPMNEGDNGGRIIETKYISEGKRPYAIIQNKKWNIAYPKSENFIINMGISCSKFITFDKKISHSWNEVTLYVPVNYNQYLDIK
ncbi:hypothetical protein LMK05_07255 [Lactococcus petauri]|nr:hypothetical protein LMK05_07255 [Lactococcus petauri]